MSLISLIPITKVNQDSNFKITFNEEKMEKTWYIIKLNSKGC